jgi:vesicle-fusing ATPase
MSRAVSAHAWESAAKGTCLKPGSAPEAALNFTNCCYASQGVLATLGLPPDGGYVEVKGCVFTLKAHASSEPEAIGFNKLQREWAKIGLSDDVYVSRFLPPADIAMGCVKFEVDLFKMPGARDPSVEMKDEELEALLRKRLQEQVLQVGQPVAVDYQGTVLRFVVLNVLGLDLGEGNAVANLTRGRLGAQTEIELQAGPSGRFHILSKKVQQRSIFRPDFNFEELGIGGLSKEFGDIFRRAFAARVFPTHVLRDLGQKHVRGMLLHGPPGTGKTLIARQLAKFLKAAEPKIVNGPEILNKYVGQAEENIRKLFADAEKEYKQQGENSQLHVIIFDEIDSICKSRGSGRDSTGVHDSIVNQLLSKIDGVDSLNNILLIGMTNRMDLIDEALLRPGRLEVHVEISLPDEAGRVEILNIHTKSMREKGYLDKSVSISALAAQSKNFSGAELDGLVRAATSFAMQRKVNFQDVMSSKDMGEIQVTAEDFEHSFQDVKPAFGQRTDEIFARCLGHGITPFSQDFRQVLNACTNLLNQVRCSENTPLLSLLLHGSPGCGKTALSAHLAKSSGYPFVRRIGPESYVGFTEMGKVAAITKVFEDAYKSELSLVVLDDLERLVEYVRLGPRFSNILLQTIFAVLKKQPPKAGRRMLVIGTTSDKTFMEDSELIRGFNVVLQQPALEETADFRAVLQDLPGFTDTVLQEVCVALRGKRIAIKTLELVAEMAVQRESPIRTGVFLECLATAAAYD